MKLNFRILLPLGTCLMAFVTVGGAASEDLRLSRTLIPAEYEDSGLKQLTSDQIAVLDALVRRDTEVLSRPAPANKPRAERFSERLSADEQNNAGLTLLSGSELAKLNAYVARLTAPIGSPSGSFASGGGTSQPWIAEKTLRRPPEIHGSITLLYGQGSGGYSERGGAMVLTYDDPSGISVAVGYSEIRTKGGYGPYYRDYYDYHRRPFGLGGYHDRSFGTGLGLRLP